MPESRTTQRVRTYVGIDPGRRTGLAYWYPGAERLEIPPAMGFWEAFDAVTSFDPESTVVVVEDPTQNRPVFRRGTSGRRREKIAQNVGMNKRDAQLWIEGLERLGYAVRRVRPTQKKWSKRTFERITGYTGRSSSHARDAARLVFGI